MLEAKQIISNVAPKSSSIKIWKDGAFFVYSLNFKFMEMAKWKASLNNQCPSYWFKIQVVTTKKKQSITIWQQICHVKGGGTLVVIFIELCFL
jgi:hypothetical protein